MNDKILLKIQKILCIIILIASAGVLLASFCYFSDGWIKFALDGSKDNYTLNFYRQLRNVYVLAYGNTLPNYSVVFESAEAAKDFYVNFWFNIQSANNALFYLGIVGLVLTAVMFICGNYGRRKYYIVNLVSGCVAGATGIIISIVSIVKSCLLIGSFNKIQADIDNFYIWTEAAGGKCDPINASSCIIGIIVPIIYMILCGLLIAFVVYKFIRTLKINKNAEVVINE